MRFCIAALACLALAAPALRAQESSAKDKETLEEARQHAAKAKVHYDLGEYREAAEEYIIVYRLRPLPALLFNIAQSYRQAGMYEKARSFYKSYLREVPDAKNKADIEKSIHEMDELLAKEKHTKNGPPKGVKEPMGSVAAGAALPVAKPPEPPATAGTRAAAPDASKQVAPPTKAAEPPKVAVATPPPQTAPAAATAPAPQPSAGKGSTTRTAAWITGGTAAALVLGGGLVAMKASGTDSDLRSGNLTRAQADSLISQSNSQHKLSGVLLGAGLAAAATSAVLFFAF